MSLFANFTRKKPRQVKVRSEEPCLHSELGPHWDSLQDMGQADRVTHYRCAACGAVITPEEVNEAKR